MSDDREMRHHDVSTALPEIDQVSPQVIESRPGARLLLRGRNLDSVTAVEVGGRNAPLRTAGSGSLLVDLPSGLVAGVQWVQAFRDVRLGEPPTSRRLYASNPVSIVLRPSLVSPPLVSEDRELVTEVEPPVASHQQVAVLLNQTGGDGTRPPASHTLPAGTPATGSSLRFPLDTVDPGTYLVRLQVAGVSSALEVDRDPASPTFDEYVAPQVTLP